MKSCLRFALLAMSILGMHAAHAQIADVAAGAKRAATCFACHGDDGVSKVPGTPHLAGQDRRYLEAALRAYRNGERQNATMTAMAQPLSETDIVNIAAYFHLSRSVPTTESLKDMLSTQRNLASVGAVYVGVEPSTSPPQTEATTASAPPPPRSAEQLFGRTCGACHSTGAAGAPKVGDADAWKPRVAQGLPTLYRHTVAGFNAMPARGACTDCSEQELHALVDYLVERSGT